MLMYASSKSLLASAIAASVLRCFGSGPAVVRRATLNIVQVFEFADKYQGSYNDSLGPAVCPFYCDFDGYQDGRVNALYSTPSIYTDAKHAETDESWPIKTDDFFPYADRANAYWTGYFTSRPAFKRYVRMMSGYYLAARQLEFYKGRSDSGPSTDALADALAIGQHHDAVTGTEKQHVANDYAKRLSMGYMEVQI